MQKNNFAFTFLLFIYVRLSNDDVRCKDHSDRRWPDYWKTNWNWPCVTLLKMLLRYLCEGIEQNVRRYKSVFGAKVRIRDLPNVEPVSYLFEHDLHFLLSFNVT